jgi:hypothetical protein
MSKKKIQENFNYYIWYYNFKITIDGVNTRKRFKKTFVKKKKKNPFQKTI